MASDRRFLPIPRRQRNTSRGIARDGLFRFRLQDGSFDWDLAKPWIESQVKSGVGSIWVSLAISLIIELIKYWLENRVHEPSAIYEMGEPGNYEVSENAD